MAAYAGIGKKPTTRRVRARKAGGTRTGGALGKKKRVRRKTKAGYFGEKVVNKVINAAGTVVGVVVGGIYKGGKAAVKQFTGGNKKAGATRTRKKKAGMQLGGAKPKRKRRANPWLAHVKKTMAANKGMAFKAVLKKAKASYKKK